MIFSVSAWLVIENGQNKGSIPLQQRSQKNKSFPFVCQATWSGKIEPGENKQDALFRECKEELGEAFAEHFYELQLKEISHIHFEDKTVYNYLGSVSESLLSLVKMHKESLGRFIFVKERTAIYPLESGKDPQQHIVLFNDQAEQLDEIRRNNR